MSIGTNTKNALKLSANELHPSYDLAVNPAYFLFTLCSFTLYLSRTILSRFIALPDLNRFRLTKPLVLFISYLPLDALPLLPIIPLYITKQLETRSVIVEV